MNKANLKSYAPKARLDFIKAVTERANVLGISAAGVVPAEVRGDVVLIDGREWPAKVAGQRDELIARIKRHGFEQTMDEVAYTWFNRFAALRYMEIHDYLGHGWRVLSSRDGGLPEILRHASEVTLPGLNPDRAREMQLAGNQDNELYKLLLVAQCNELSRVMPFLFERIDDETELLLPENLLRTDSIVAKLVEQVPEEDWQAIEVIGWLYQFYISEKKDQVIGKVVKSEDIPAATQLFTPNWIVQYLVQNSVGRLWLMANPTSTLATQWPYYIQPAEQTPAVQAQLDALIQTRIREDGETLNPETITVLDPACGSGHILVVAYDVLKAIYLERGYQPRSIPRIILERNLYGLDIDDRAGQLAAFSLLMKARADDRRLFNDPPKLNVLALRESEGLDAAELTVHLALFGLNPAVIKTLLDTFKQAKTFGSLIQIPATLNEQLNAMTSGLQRALQEGDLYAQQAAKDLLPLVWQALILRAHFDAVVANPPYMGGKFMNGAVKQFVKSDFAAAKSDLFACFMDRSRRFIKSSGYASSVTLDGWLSLPSYNELRKSILRENTICSLVHVGWNCFPEGHVYNRGVMFTVSGSNSREFGSFMNLSDVPASVDKNELFSSRKKSGDGCYFVDQIEFDRISGSPIAYWVDQGIVALFDATKVADLFEVKEGLGTRDDARFMRFHWEVSQARIRRSASGLEKWIKADKAGQFRRWYGNQRYVLNWAQDGHEIKNFRNEDGSLKSRPQNTQYFFREAVSWGKVGSGLTSFRYRDATGAFTDAAPSVFGNDPFGIIGLLNSNVFELLLEIQGGTINVAVGVVSGLPVLNGAITSSSRERVKLAIELSKQDWDEFEGSMDFRAPYLSQVRIASGLLGDAWQDWAREAETRFQKMREIEAGNNSHFITAYGLDAKLSAAVDDKLISLAKADRGDDSRRLVSYIVGCIVGRYSLDEPGIIYADAGNIGFDPSRYQKFEADSDAIVPLTEDRWFESDGASRVREFLRTVWGVELLEVNIAWLAESLGAKGSETPEETVRRYLAENFFKDHLQTYKKRPIYWLFSSGKQGAFQALVYMHRYNEGTLARMRAEYVVPLIAKLASRLDMLDKDVDAASSAAARTKLQKQIESLRRKQIELLAYDERLRHYADMRIALDLDDGVKVNYARFGDLVAESKAITGGSDE